jgi:hypothetical protein
MSDGAHAKPTTSGCVEFKVSNWKPYTKNTLRGFLSLELPSGMIVQDCALHTKGDSRWIGLPARPYEKDGEKSWSPIIEFTSKATRDRFQEQALAAVDKHLGGRQ